MNAKKTSAALPKRDPRLKFVELARTRVARCLRDMRLIGNLANRHNYEYTDAEAKKIIKALEGGLEHVRAEFVGKRGRPEDLFTL